MIDYSGWLTKQQAADALNVSTKTIEGLAKDGKLQQATWRRPGGGARIAVYHPDDVARMAKERQPGPSAFVLPATSGLPPTNGNGHGSLVPRETSQAVSPLRPDDEPLRMLFAAALRAVTSQSSEKPAPLFLTLAEASTVSGLSERCLRRCIKEGKLEAVRDRGLRIRRRDLEAL